MPTNIEQEIQQLITELEELKIEFNSKSDNITRKLIRLNRKVKRSKQTENSNELVVGEVVRITNNYKGTRGITGIIERVTDKQVTIKNQDTNRRYTRSKTNVEKVL